MRHLYPILTVLTLLLASCSNDEPPVNKVEEHDQDFPELSAITSLGNTGWERGMAQGYCRLLIGQDSNTIYYNYYNLRSQILVTTSLEGEINYILTGFKGYSVITLEDQYRLLQADDYNFKEFSAHRTIPAEGKDALYKIALFLGDITSISPFADNLAPGDWNTLKLFSTETLGVVDMSQLPPVRLAVAPEPVTMLKDKREKTHQSNTFILFRNCFPKLDSVGEVNGHQEAFISLPTMKTIPWYLTTNLQPEKTDQTRNNVYLGIMTADRTILSEQLMGRDSVPQTVRMEIPIIQGGLTPFLRSSRVNGISDTPNPMFLRD